MMHIENPLLYDVFCGAGGAAMGYHRAGFEVVGVDHKPQKNYPFEFIQMDALEFLQEIIDGKRPKPDAIHASPPCQAHTVGLNNTGLGKHIIHPDLVTPTRYLLPKLGLPYVIENVVTSPLRNWILMCGLMFGLNTLRHRWFESNLALWSAGHPRHQGTIYKGDYVPVYNGKWRDSNSQYPVPKELLTKAAWSEAMGIDWMTKQELTQAIPPAYTEFIGKQLIQRL